MRQATFREFFILSAHLDTLNFENNHKRSRELYHTLIDLGINFSCVEGFYKGKKDVSYFITGKDVENNIQELAKLYNQECYLKRCKDNEGYLVYPNGQSESIGTPKQIMFSELKDYDGYTVLPQKDGSKVYFTFLKEQ